jgi:hypothetical protein
MNTEKLESHHEGWRTLWLAIVGVMAITLTNVLETWEQSQTKAAYYDAQEAR